jgi:NADPH-dependent glutamate synthase beta subunit-like oxidoreductase
MINLKIDGRETKVKEGTYVLEAAKALGIEIPSMCHLDSMEPFATCMLCIVKDRNTGKLFPSCSVRPEEGMDITTNDTEVYEARKTALELLLSDHVGDCEAPCQISCPAHMDIPQMNRLLAMGEFDAALDLVKRDIALPSVLGRICPAPCEAACRRKPIDQAVSICLLKRYAGDFGNITLKQEKHSGKKAAVIGSGPAGLSAAYYLQIRGITCEIFDSGIAPGGALRYKLPKEDLPEEVLDREIAAILRTGIIIHSGHRVDKEEFAGIREKFDAVVIATGDFSEDQQDWGLDFSEKGFTADKKKYTTNLEGIFVAGNSIRSQKMAVRASGQGKEAAFAVQQYLSGEEILGESRVFNSRFGKLMEKEFQYYLLESVPDNRFEPGAGMKTGFDQEEVRKEAARCMHCDCRKLDNCRLRDLSDQYAANQKHYWNTERKHISKSIQHELIAYEPRKCIKCSLCVRLTEKYREKIGFTFIGRGFDVEIGAPFNEELRNALTDSAREAAEACPTGALAFNNREKE